jgi:hypothetical protein
MANDHISTFEKDIENEIRTKSASLSDIAAASGVVDNKPEKNALYLVILVVIALTVLLVGIGTYLYYTKLQRAGSPPADTQTKDTKTSDIFENKKDLIPAAVPANDKKGVGGMGDNLNEKKPATTSLEKLLPSIFPYVQRNLVKAETYQGSYIITFTGYNELYKTVFDNETLFLKDALALYGDVPAGDTSFRDVSIGEIDARTTVGKGGKTVYYAFIKPSLLIISDKDEALAKIVEIVVK